MRVLNIEDFIDRWKHSGGSERANFQTFANELCEVLDLPKPDPAKEATRANSYCFEHPVTFIHTGTQSRGFIDLYHAGHFVMEAKQGTDGAAPEDDAQPALIPDLPSATRKGHGTRGTRRWDDTMLRARNQADGYARAVSRTDGWPPFLLVVDVGHVIEVYADFSGQGQGYTQYPDGNRYRITMEDLRDQETRDRLRAIWTDPHALDPAKISAKVTREVADRLAALGRSFEGQGHESEAVARFLMRCLFTMFAEDVDLIPMGSFSDLLDRLRGHPEHAAPTLKALWDTMNTGGFSPVLTADLKRFNGGLFKDAEALPLSEVQLSLLIDAANRDWRAVEPAIFGTLLERALDKRQRHKLGAHYTPRAYVERLVVPTIMEPLRADWRDVQVAAATLAKQGKQEEARETVRAFHLRLCEIKVLDPACGSGNFLYVALELMKRLEGEVTALLHDLGEEQTALALAGHTVDPHQFLGLEVNPWAAAVAELVLWIGYLQWHFRTHGKASPAEPVLRDFHNIECRDALMTWASTQPRLDERGEPVTRWDGIGTILHPITGERVPDPAARVAVLDYMTPAPAQWPEADFIVGNPPFIGASRMRDALGDGYTEALWATYPKMPQSADFVMFWWHKAALAARGFKAASGKARAKGARRFGFITTNSLRQTFNRKVLEPHLNDPKTPLSLAFAIPDHPWVDASDGAAVRIAMTVAEAGKAPGRLLTVTEEAKGESEAEGRPVKLQMEKGKLFSNLRIGADVAGAKPLRANEGLSSPGVKLHGSGFIVTPSEARALGLGTVPGLENNIRHYRNGRDLTATPRGVMVIDLFGLTEADVRSRFPAVYQHVWDKVKPERDQNNREGYKRNWWIHGEPRKDLRPALAGLPRFIATVETTKHRVCQFLDGATLPDNMLIAVALDDAAWLSVLSSQVHVIWALSAGARLGVGNDPRYTKSKCFDPFPFPALTEAQKIHLRSLGEQLDAHRKAQQKAHPKLTLTGMYNVLEKLRAGERIEGKDREIYDQGLLGILRAIHDQIDTSVAEAYGWPADLSEDGILHRLVDLNRERAAEEARGDVRWLRPEYQNPQGRAAVGKGEQAAMEIGPSDTTQKAPWPKSLPEQIAAVRAVLNDMGTATPEQVARTFQRGRAASVQPLLESLTAIGQARFTEDGRFAA
ncbi:type II restriction/modification system DNA methylase subunit YeeA [Rhodobacter aestuarii]|uniref:site-specific DNA-methyltransferase (adenine-specific) n=1 Tax=Rhodobacter aestuarii TaxID=453582 RepID=A0A1N7JYN3_9RHOB|nr:DNA methyltransferase [Rhodobacter aestuarii]PTV95932.1 type II restriction/modification system DNA methylase subunit YeeA [Rhodobacter aestuarii]SIS54437.1 Type II restriction/modification system, DNA methylase subunit YeeA [Rhodobacter aestuarii]